MAYKKVALRKRRTSQVFTVAGTQVISQRNGVTALRTDATMDHDGQSRNVVIFANGRRVGEVGPALVPGATVPLLGKFSQHNTFVAFGVGTEG